MEKSLQKIGAWGVYGIFRSLYVGLFYLLPSLVALYVLIVILKKLQSLGVSDGAVIEAAHKIDVAGFLLMAGAIVGVIANKEHSRKSLVGAVLAGFAMAMSSVVIGLTPQEVPWSELGSEEAKLLYSSLLGLSTSIFLTMYFCVLAITRIEPWLDHVANVCTSGVSRVTHHQKSYD